MPTSGSKHKDATETKETTPVMSGPKTKAKDSKAKDVKDAVKVCYVSDQKSKI